IRHLAGGRRSARRERELARTELARLIENRGDSRAVRPGPDRELILALVGRKRRLCYDRDIVLITHQLFGSAQKCLTVFADESLSAGRQRHEIEKPLIELFADAEREDADAGSLRQRHEL